MLRLVNPRDRGSGEVRCSSAVGGEYGDSAVELRFRSVRRPGGDRTLLIARTIDRWFCRRSPTASASKIVQLTLVPQGGNREIG